MQPIVAIFGPTAGGKSALAMSLAEARGGEIVACDAVMVYRGFDIGSNKPTAGERARLPHHLLDVCDANQPMNAARYAELAEEAITSVAARGRLPVVVVGTFLYYRALVYGLGALPPSEPVLRAELLQREADAPGFLAREVERIDPVSFREANGKNLSRLVRALEVFRLSGERASDLRAAHGFATARYAVERIGLRPPREVLWQRIAERARAMLDSGLVEEVERLRHSVDRSARPMRALGYAQVNDAIDAGEIDRPAVAEAISVATRQYARRQASFFKKEPGIAWR